MQYQNHEIVHILDCGVQLTASVSTINSGPGFPLLPSESLATNRSEYVAPGFKSSTERVILLPFFSEDDICTTPPYDQSCAYSL